MEIRYGQGLHSNLGHFAYGVDPAPGMERLALLREKREGMVHVFHSFFSFPVGPYAIDIRILSFSGELPI